MKASATIHYLGAIIRPRGSSFMAEVNHQYARHRKTFKSVAQAKGWIDKLQAQILSAGAPLSNREISDAADVLRRIPAGVTLNDLLEYWSRHHVAVDTSVTGTALVDAYIAEKVRAGRRPRSVQDLRSRLGIWARDMGGIPVSEVTAQALGEWLDRKGYTGVTRKNFRTVLVGFFNYAGGLHATASNPAAAIAVQTVDDAMPEIFTVAQAQALLRAAEARRPDLVPWLAIGLFAGLRTAELWQLRWEAVDIPGRLITVRPETAKRRRQRHVIMADNLAAWLTDYAGTGRVSPAESTVRRALTDEDGLVQAAGLPGWPHNAMRHSFGSYHLAAYQDGPRTAFEMGHTQPDVLYTHYRNLVRPDDAQAYWEIRPAAPARVVRLPAVAG